MEQTYPAVGGRHIFLLELCERLKDAGIPFEIAKEMIVSLAEKNQDDEDRGYIAESVYAEEKDAQTIYIFTSGYGEDNHIIAVLAGPVGASMSFLKQEFSQLPDTVPPNEFLNWLMNRKGWLEVGNWNDIYLPEERQSYAPAKRVIHPLEDDEED